jgi:anti-sigma-K factor RskA
MTTDHELAPLYALDALDDDEAREFAAHLEDCARCQQEVQELSGPLEALASAHEEPPPSELRSSVLAAIAQTPQMPAAGRSLSDPSPARIPEVSGAEQPSPGSAGRRLRSIDGGQHASGRSAGRRRRPLLTALVSAAAAVVLVGAVGWGWNAHQTSQQVLAQQQLTAQLLGAPDAIRASAPMGDGVGTVVVSKQRGQAIILMDHVPEAPEGKVYEAWTIRGTPVAAGTFTAEDAPLVHLPAAALTADTIAVTVEPEGGVAAPTGQAVFKVSLT